MRIPARILPKSVRSQIIGLVAIAVILGVGLTATTLQFVNTAGPKDGPGIFAGRLAEIVQLVKAEPPSVDTDNLLAAARRAGIDVNFVALPAEEPAVDPKQRPATAVAQILRSIWGIPAEDSATRSGAPSITVKLGDRALVFRLSKEFGPPRFVVAPALLVISITGFFIILLSIYAFRSIVAPLSSMASAVRGLGYSSSDTALNELGPREISQVARALNEMGARIRSLIDARTRMLAAISHDLRTPLTRLRLRAERLTPADGQEGMLSDIARISDMLGETLVYLRDGARSEAEQRADLPSLLQTICAEFADVGHAVTYAGPNRFACTCRPGALTRAVTNVVENGIKYGSVVMVTLKITDADTVRIDVSDDGCGIPVALREQVFEPFFRGDGARGSPGQAGFGLGLSIAHDIIRGHGGRIELLDRQPHGLIVRMSLRRNG